MRITFGIKAVAGCILASVVSLAIALSVQLSLQGYTALAVLGGLAGGAVVGLLFAWHLHQRFKALLQGLHKALHTPWAGLAKMVGGKDELGEVAALLEQCYQNFQVEIREVQNLFTTVSRLNTEIALSMHELMKNMDNQGTAARQLASHTVETHGAIQELHRKTTGLSSSVAATAQELGILSSSIAAEVNKVSHASKFSQEAVEVAREGTAAVEEMEKGTQMISTNVKKAAQTIEQLGKNADEIEEIISVIDDIADQTNLLALNAAIEAARAGEQGRGFAVVADSVRNLSEKTQKATKEIVGMIQKLQAETKGAVSSMEGGNKEVETGVNMAVKAGENLKKIVSSMEKVYELIVQIHQQTQEQEQSKAKIVTVTNTTQGLTQEVEDTTTQQQEKCRTIRKEVEEVERLGNNNTQILTRLHRDWEEITLHANSLKNFFDKFLMKEEEAKPPVNQENPNKKDVEPVEKKENKDAMGA